MNRSNIQNLNSQISNLITSSAPCDNDQGSLKLRRCRAPQLSADLQPHEWAILFSAPGVCPVRAAWHLRRLSKFHVHKYLPKAPAETTPGLSTPLPPVW